MGFSRHELNHLSANVDHATIRNPQGARRAERKVEHAAGNPRSAVGDDNYYGLAGRKIGHANSRAERQAADVAAEDDAAVVAMA